MSQGEENSDAKLWEEYANSPTEACRERIVKRYLPLIKYVVARMAVTPPPGLDYEDLLSFGVFGLLDAIERFDLSNDVKVISYSKWWIIQRMQNAILRKTRMPESELPHDGVDDYDSDNIFDANSEVTSTSQEFIVDEEERTDARCDTDFIEDIMSILSDREADIINMYYGRCGYKENTLDEIGKKYKLTKERVRQIMRTALNKIRSESMKSDNKYLSR